MEVRQLLISRFIKSVKKFRFATKTQQSLTVPSKTVHVQRSNGAFRSRGFAFSVDSAFAVILFITFIAVILSLNNSPQTSSISQASVIGNNVFSALNTSGYLLSTIDSNTPTNSLSLIYSRASSLLLSSYDMRLRLTQFDLNANDCQSVGDFESCFIESFSSSAGSALPSDKTVSLGQKVLIKRQPPSECTEPVGGLSAGINTYSGPLFFQTADENFLASLEFDVNTFPAGPIACDQNVTVTLSVEVSDTVRRPVDVMIVLDRSGSMSWSGIEQDSIPSSLWIDGNTAVTAELGLGTSTIDITNPLIPNQLDNDFPGNVTDVYGRSGNYFAGELTGTDQVFSYNFSDPSNITQLGNVSFESSSGVVGVFSDNRYLYVAGDRTGSGNNRGLYIFDANNPSSMTFLGRINLSNAADVYVDGNTAYVARLGDGLSTVNVANKASPVLLDTLDPGGTNNGVFVNGNYAYVAAGALGLVIFDVSDPSNLVVLGTHTPGTGDALNVYVDNALNEAFLANSTSLYIIDVNNPSSPAFSRSFATTYAYRDVWVQGGYAYLGSTIGFVSIDIFDGPRINNAKVAAKNFVDFNGWNLPPDQFGLASFNTSATLNRQLTTDANLVKTSIDSLTATGGTNIESGIVAATNELLSVRANPSALKFQVLLSDGQSNQGNSASAAITAAANGITIYTIAFGADADVNELQTVANITGGTAYLATDENTLVDVFNLISEEIFETAQDANIIVPLSGGEVLVDSGDANYTFESLVFDTNALQPGEPWVRSYTIYFPCDLAKNCSLEAVTFPGDGTQFNYVDSNGLSHSIDFNASTTLDFLTRDLSVIILGGEIISDTEVLLDVNVTNDGDLNTGSTSLVFRLNDSNGPIIGTESVPALCGDSDTSCNYFSSEFFENVNVGVSGTIYAGINEDEALSECPLNNFDLINCSQAPKTQYYLLEYWVWKK